MATVKPCTPTATFLVWRRSKPLHPSTGHLHLESVRFWYGTRRLKCSFLSIDSMDRQTERDSPFQSVGNSASMLRRFHSTRLRARGIGTRNGLRIVLIPQATDQFPRSSTASARSGRVASGFTFGSDNLRPATIIPCPDEDQGGRPFWLSQKRANSSNHRVVRVLKNSDPPPGI
jgi:hypothetical protein